MNIRQLAHRSVSVCLTAAIISVYSMVSLAANAPVGELTLTGSIVPGGQPVTVNGEPTVVSRTVYASNAIATPDALGAEISLGANGKIRIAPNSNFTLASDGGTLVAGKVTAVGNSNPLTIRTNAGDISLNAGQTADANLPSPAPPPPPKKVVLPIFGAVAVWVVVAVTAGVVLGTVAIVNATNDNGSGGNGNGSPVR